MEPFGPENMQPVFLIKNLIDTGYSKIVKEEHIRFVLQQNNQTITGIGFNMAKNFTLLTNQKPIDVVCTIDLNEYMGEKKLQLKIIDIKPFT
jgi:single-stranded-DNA-specific exonuclease